MKRFIISILLVALLLIISTPALAATGMPGDADKDNTLTKQELSAYVLSCMAGSTKAEDAQDAAHMYAYWDGKPRSIVDSANRTVTIYRPIDRIVGLHTSPCREFCMLGVEDRVVGATKYTWDDPLMYPRLLDKANVGTTSDPDFEKIIALNPDVVITTSGSNLNNTIDKLQPAGITVIALHLSSYYGEDEYDMEVHELGYLLDCEERADAFVAWKNTIYSMIENRTADIKVEDRPSVLGLALSGVLKGDAEISQGMSPRRIIPQSSGTDLSAGTPGGAKIDSEWIVKSNPDAILLESTDVKTGFGYVVNNTTLASASLNKALEHPAIKATNASKNSQVYIYGYYGLGSGGQSELGALYLAKKLYPDRFADVDPARFHREYYEQWLGIPYSGVWFY